MPFQEAKRYRSLATSERDDSGVPCSERRNANSEDSFMRCSSLSDSNVSLPDSPASFNSSSAPASFPETPMRYGSVDEARPSKVFPGWSSEPGDLSIIPRSVPSSRSQRLRPETPFIVCLSPAMPAKATGSRSQLASSTVAAKSMHTAEAEADTMPSIPARCGLTNMILDESRNGEW